MKISVIVPVYNVEKYLAACIESILAQTFTDFELLLINDGSTDYSYKICQEFAQKDWRIKVFSQENQGVASARNLGLECAQGEYITFIDPDDKVGIHYLAILYALATTQKAEIVVGEYYQYIEEDSLFIFYIAETDKRIDVFENNDFLAKFNRVAFATVWGKLFQAKLFKYVRFPKLSVHEDNYVIQKLYLMANRIVYVADDMYFYRTHTESLINKEKSLKDIEDYYTALEEQYFDLMLAKQDLTLVKENYQIGLNKYKHYLEERGLVDARIYLKICQRLEMINRYGG